MRKIFRTSAPFLFAMVLPSLVFAGDLKFTQRIFLDNWLSHDAVYYVKGERKRIDSQSYVGGQTPESFIYGPHTATIMQCDLNRTLILNLDAKKYIVHEIKLQPLGRITGFLSAGPLTGATAANKNYSEVRAVSVKGTGDKRDFHGHEAWLVRETTKSTTNYGGNTTRSSSVEETWYIDLDAPTYCPKQFGLAPNMKAQSRLGVLGQNVTETRTGTARIGFPISQKEMTMSGMGGMRLQSRMEILDWSEEPLDPKLFEVPDGFTETKEWKDIAPRLGRASTPTGTWENFLRWAQHFFSTL
jgi:hypothetical protein